MQIGNSCMVEFDTAVRNLYEDWIAQADEGRFPTSGPAADFIMLNMQSAEDAFGIDTPNSVEELGQDMIATLLSEALSGRIDYADVCGGGTDVNDLAVSAATPVRSTAILAMFGAMIIGIWL